jgi:hypothetical protein
LKVRACEQASDDAPQRRRQHDPEVANATIHRLLTKKFERP